jgi:hypothetical protein
MAWRIGVAVAAVAAALIPGRVGTRQLIREPALPDAVDPAMADRPFFRPRSAVRNGSKKTVRPGDEGQAGGNDAPHDHDAGDSTARAEAMQREVARNFQDEIADEENSGAPRIDQRRKAEIGIHGQRRKDDIDAIEHAEEIGNDQKRNQPIRYRRWSALRRRPDDADRDQPSQRPLTQNF